MREVIKEGRDVNEAIDLACAQLGVDRGQASFEIIELPKTSLFGLRKKPAKVRVYVEEPEAPKKKPEKTAPRKEPAREAAKQEKPEPRQTPPKQQPKEAKQPEPKQEPKKQEPRQEKPAKAPEKPVTDAPAARAPEKAQAAAETEKKPREEAQESRQEIPASKFLPMEETEGKVRTACDYVQSVLTEMGVNARITVAQNDNGIVIRLAGDGLGVVIGRRGETLDALQYLSGLVANRCEGDYLRVTIDTGNYREKRERTLQQLARKLSASALRSGRSSMLEPMNPYERRIIHSTVSQIEGVTSSSIGEEPNRRVVISPVNAKPRPPRRGPGGPGGAGGQGGPRRGSYGGKRPPRYGEGTGENRERPPRRDRGDQQRTDRRPAEARPTSTEVDRAYAKELEREPAFAKPEQPAHPDGRERVTRDKPKDEAGDMPLYGKIEL